MIECLKIGDRVLVLSLLNINLCVVKREDSDRLSPSIITTYCVHIPDITASESRSEVVSCWAATSLPCSACILGSAILLTLISISSRILTPYRSFFSEIRTHAVSLDLEQKKRGEAFRSLERMLATTVLRNSFASSILPNSNYSPELTSISAVITHPLISQYSFSLSSMYRIEVFTRLRSIPSYGLGTTTP